MLGALAPGTESVLWGMAGGLLPDLDLLFGKHRRTLHFPWLYGLGSGAAQFLSALTGGSGLVAVFLAAASVHSISDRFAGAELRSWDRDSWRDEAVYDHVRNKWMSPARLVHGGSPRDLALCVSLGAALMFTGVAPVARGLTGALVVTGVGMFLIIRRFGAAVPDRYNTLNSYVRDRLGLS
nr:MAG: hypothetical protein J07AB56_09580 [Candidatus Nanosalinarum sp. J07AB56]